MTPPELPGDAPVPHPVEPAATHPEFRSWPQNASCRCRPCILMSVDINSGLIQGSDVAQWCSADPVQAVVWRQWPCCLPWGQDMQGGPELKSSKQCTAISGLYKGFLEANSR